MHKVRINRKASWFKRRIVPQFEKGKASYSRSDTFYFEVGDCGLKSLGILQMPSEGLVDRYARGKTLAGVPAW